MANPSADSEHGLVRVVVRCVELLPSGSAQSSGAAASTDLARPTHSLPAYLSLWCKRREHERRARLLQQLRGAGAPGDNRAQLPTSSASPPLPSLTADLLRELYPNAPVVHLCECNDATGCTPECPAAAAGPPTATTATLSDTTTTTIISGLDTPPLPAASVNLTPTLLLIRHGNYCLLVQSYHRHTLDNVVCQCPGVLGRSVARPLFVTYQLILALRRLHALGLPHGR